jgi:hypothetical protein
MKKSEPVIIANGHTDTEINQWMKNKIEEFRIIENLIQEKASLEERLSEVNKKLKILNPEKPTVPFPPNQDSILHQEYR